MKKIYVCTPLNPNKFNLDKITDILMKMNVFAFIPPAGQLSNKETGALLDKRMIEECNEVYVIGAVGRDCCWEIGYASGLGKPVTIFLDHTNNYLIEEDWMVTLGCNIVDINVLTIIES